MPDGYRLHDLVLQYVQLTIRMDDGHVAEIASSRQARFLATPRVFKRYSVRGMNVSNGGTYSLVSLWNSVKELDRMVDAEACYTESLAGVVDIELKREVARLFILLVRQATNPRAIRLSFCRT